MLVQRFTEIRRVVAIGRRAFVQFSFRMPHHVNLQVPCPDEPCIAHFARKRFVAQVDGVDVPLHVTLVPIGVTAVGTRVRSFRRVSAEVPAEIESIPEGHGTFGAFVGFFRHVFVFDVFLQRTFVNKSFLAKRARFSADIVVNSSDVFR